MLGYSALTAPNTGYYTSNTQLDMITFQFSTERMSASLTQ